MTIIAPIVTQFLRTTAESTTETTILLDWEIWLIRNLDWTYTQRIWDWITQFKDLPNALDLNEAYNLANETFENFPMLSWSYSGLKPSTIVSKLLNTKTTILKKIKLLVSDVWTDLTWTTNLTSDVTRVWSVVWESEDGSIKYAWVYWSYLYKSVDGWAFVPVTNTNVNYTWNFYVSPDGGEVLCAVAGSAKLFFYKDSTSTETLFDIPHEVNTLSPHYWAWFNHFYWVSATIANKPIYFTRSWDVFTWTVMTAFPVTTWNVPLGIDCASDSPWTIHWAQFNTVWGSYSSTDFWASWTQKTDMNAVTNNTGNAPTSLRWVLVNNDWTKVVLVWIKWANVIAVTWDSVSSWISTNSWVTFTQKVNLPYVFAINSTKDFSFITASQWWYSYSSYQKSIYVSTDNLTSIWFSIVPTFTWAWSQSFPTNIFIRPDKKEILLVSTVADYIKKTWYTWVLNFSLTKNSSTANILSSTFWINSDVDSKNAWGVYFKEIDVSAEEISVTNWDKLNLYVNNWDLPTWAEAFVTLVI